jgi:hypothetical protein
MEKRETEIHAQQELLQARACINRARIELDESQRCALLDRSKTHLKAVWELMQEGGLEPRKIGTSHNELSRLHAQSLGIPTFSQRCPP